MRTKAFITCVIALVAICILSCDKDENEVQEPVNQEPVSEIIGNSRQPYNYGEVETADGITGVVLYVVENFRGLSYRPDNGPVSDYSTFQILGEINHGPLRCVDTTYEKYSSEIQDAVEYMQEGFERARTQFMQDAFIANYGEPDYTFGSNYLDKWPYLYTAYINGDITISCDKKLFGKEPGEDISQYFNVYGTANCVPIGRKNPTVLYNFEEEKPKAISELMQKDTWLQRYFYFYFREIPEEKYDTLTFKITIPITREHYTRYFYSICLGENEPLKVTNDTLVSERQVIIKPKVVIE
jgi:hypothetical protein